MDDSRIRSKTAPFSFENGLVWTGPQCYEKLLRDLEHSRICNFVSNLLAYLGPDYMSWAGPVSRAGVSLPGSRHVC